MAPGSYLVPPRHCAAGLSSRSPTGPHQCLSPTSCHTARVDCCKLNPIHQLPAPERQSPPQPALRCQQNMSLRAHQACRHSLCANRWRAAAACPVYKTLGQQMHRYRQVKSPAKQHTQKAVERRDGLHALQTLQYMQALHTQSNASSSVDCHYVTAHQHQQQQRYHDVSYAAVLQHCPLKPTRCCMHQMPIHSATTEGCGGCAGESRHNPVWHLGPSQVTHVGMDDTPASAPTPIPPIP